MFCFLKKFTLCCNSEKENENISITPINNNINVIQGKEKDNILFGKDDILKRRKSRNSSININNNQSHEKSLSMISFSNMKVNERKETINQIFDTEVLSTVELKLIGEIFWNKELYIDRIGLKIGNRIKNPSNRNNSELSIVKNFPYKTYSNTKYLKNISLTNNNSSNNKIEKNKKMKNY